MDILSRIMYSPRIDYLVAFAVTIIAVGTGTMLGSVVGYHGGWLDAVVMRIADSLQAFPVLVLAMAAVGVLSQRASGQAASTGVVIVVIAIVQAPSYLRLVRARFLSLRSAEFVDAARALGVPTRSIMYRHMLPNALAPIFPTAAQNAGYAILLTAGMAFVGVGVTPPTPEWGSMISVGAQYLITGQWWMSFFPGMAIALTILGLTLVSDALQDLTRVSVSG
jgi:peptide/nickel transport system permease protein